MGFVNIYLVPTYLDSTYINSVTLWNEGIAPLIQCCNSCIVSSDTHRLNEIQHDSNPSCSFDDITLLLPASSSTANKILYPNKSRRSENDEARDF